MTIGKSIGNQRNKIIRMTKKKSIFDSIGEDLHNKRDERKKREKDENNSFYYEL